MGKLKNTLLLISGLVPLLGLFSPTPDLVPLVYSVFVVTYFLAPIRKLFVWIPLNKSLKFATVTLITSLGLLELPSWIGEFLNCSPNPALLHPQLIPDLLLGVFFYLGWPLAWILVFKKYHFNVGEIFTTQGLFGVFIEQQGAIFLQGLTSFPVGLIWWVYVFVVYGSTMAIGFLLGWGETKDSRSSGKLKYILALALITVFTLGFSILGSVILYSVGFISDPKPICQFPLI